MLLHLLLYLPTAAADMSPKIVGGGEANIEDWPFIAFIAIISSDAAATCGGSLISSQTVLTAAHCLDDITDSKNDEHLFNYSIMMGHRKFQNAKMVRKVLDYETHHNYDLSGTACDIGVMFLTKPVAFSRTVKKVLLMNRMSFKKDKYMEVAGWGAWSVDLASNSPVLKSLSQILIPKQRCTNYLEAGDMTEGVICAGKINASEFAYSGDSGGPLVKAGTQLQMGIVSFRLESHGITVYTSVPYFYNWIEDTQNRLFLKHCLNKKLNVHRGLYKPLNRGTIRGIPLSEYDDDNI